MRSPEPARETELTSVSAGQPVCGAPRRNRTGDPILTMANGELLPACSKHWIPREIAKIPQAGGEGWQQRRGDPWRSFVRLPDPSAGVLLPGCCPSVNPGLSDDESV